MESHHFQALYMMSGVRETLEFFKRRQVIFQGDAETRNGIRACLSLLKKCPPSTENKLLCESGSCFKVSRRMTAESLVLCWSWWIGLYPGVAGLWKVHKCQVLGWRLPMLAFSFLFPFLHSNGVSVLGF